MSLRDQIDRQDEGAQGLQVRLSALASEFADLMRSMGVAPVCLLDTNGQVRGERTFDSDTNTYIGVRRTPNLAWLAHVSGRVSSPNIVVTTDGQMLFSEVGPTEFHMDASYGFLVLGRGGDDTERGFVLRGHEYSFTPGARPDTWAEAREHAQLSALIDLAETAHLEGVDAAIGPIEVAMLKTYNRLRKS